MFDLLGDRPQNPGITHAEEKQAIIYAMSREVPFYTQHLTPISFNMMRLDQTLRELDKDYTASDEEIALENLAQFHFTPSKNLQIVTGSYTVIGFVETVGKIPLALGVAPHMDLSDFDYGEHRELCRLAFDAIDEKYELDGGGDGMDYVMGTPDDFAHMSILIDGALDSRGGYKSPKVWINVNNPQPGIALCNAYADLINMALEDKLRSRLSMEYNLDGETLAPGSINTSYTKKGRQALHESE